MSAPLQQGIARVRATQDGPVIGTAFLISQRHVMSCAHVVNEALGEPWDGTKRPGHPVWIEFPFWQSGSGSGLAATVLEWRPSAAAPAADIVVLELEREV